MMKITVEVELKKQTVVERIAGEVAVVHCVVEQEGLPQRNIYPYRIFETMDGKFGIVKHPSGNDPYPEIFFSGEMRKLVEDYVSLEMSRLLKRDLN